MHVEAVTLPCKAGSLTACQVGTGRQECIHACLCVHACALQACHSDSSLASAHSFVPPGHLLYYERHKAALHKDPCCCNPCLDYMLDAVQYKTRCVRAHAHRM